MIFGIPIMLAEAISQWTNEAADHNFKQEHNIKFP
jgi:hypothetical protein